MMDSFKVVFMHNANSHPYGCIEHTCSTFEQAVKLINQLIDHIEMLNKAGLMDRYPYTGHIEKNVDGSWMPVFKND